MAGDKIVSGIIMFPSLKGYSYGLSLLLLASLFVFGFGNSGNFFGVDAEAEMLALDCRMIQMYRRSKMRTCFEYMRLFIRRRSTAIFVHPW